MAKKKKTNEYIEGVAEDGNAVYQAPIEDIKQISTFEARNNADDYLSVEEQNCYFGPRQVAAFTDGSILNEKLGMKYGHGCKKMSCNLLLDKKTGAYLGIIPKLSLNSVWRKASTVLKKSPASAYGITEREWETDKKQLLANVPKNDGKNVFVQDVVQLTAMEYRRLFLKHGEVEIQLLGDAIKADLLETRKLQRNWYKIWRYPHRVSLMASYGGIFTESEAKTLYENGIKKLNDIAKTDIYRLKNILPDFDFSTLIKRLNAAFKEDLAKRRDKQYKIYPFIFAMLAIAATLAIGVQFKYTLIKNVEMSFALYGLAAFWLLHVGVVIWAIIRVKKRRKKHPSYTYLTRAVKRAIRGSAVVSLAVFSLIGVFYLRYDGYNNFVYYRDLDDGNITIAGLVDTNINASIEETMNIYVDQTIDGKTVAQIDKGAFKGEQFQTIVLPNTVKEIEAKAFSKNTSLNSVSLQNSKEQGVETIGEKAFYGCTLLNRVELSQSVQRIEKQAFSSCSSLTTLSPFENLSYVGEYAFENCTYSKFDLPETLTEIGKNAFARSNIQNFIAKECITKIGDNAFEECYSLTNVEFSEQSVVEFGVGVFKNCLNLNEVALPNVTAIPQETFYNCTYITQLNVPASVVEIGQSSFYGTGITELIIDANVSKIGEQAFMENTNLSKLVIPATVMEIGKKAFADCHNLQEIQVPFLGESITQEKGKFKDVFGDKSESFYSLSITLTNQQYVNKGTFSGARNARSIVLNEGITEIGEETFKDFTNLEEIYLPSTLTKIGQSAFRGSSITSLNWENTAISEIGAYAYADCYRIEEADFTVIPVVSIGEGVFSACTNLQNIEFPVDLQEIPNRVAANCTSLKEINLSSNARKIGKWAFVGSGLTSLYIPSTMEEIGKEAFGDCYSLTVVDVPFLGKNQTDLKGGYAYLFGDSPIETIRARNLSIINDKTFKGAKSVKEIHLNEGVTEIGDNAFKSLEFLSTINVPSTVLRLGKNAFASCYELHDLDLTGTQIVSVGASAFNGSGIENILLPIGIADIQASAFANCYMLENITLPSAVTMLGDSAFKNSGLREIDLRNVQNIGAKAFQDCEYLTRVEVPDSVEKMGKHAFAYCEQLRYFKAPFIGKSTTNTRRGFKYTLKGTEIKELVLTETMELSSNTFRGANFIQSIVLNEGITRLPRKTFKGLETLTSISLPSTLTEIGNKVFADCESLEQLDFSNMQVTEFGRSVFRNCSQLESIRLPYGLQSLPAKFLKGCTSLTSIQIPNSVTEIGDSAFEECDNLQSLSLPDSVTAIGKDMAYGCMSLKEVHLSNGLTVISKRAFKNCTQLHSVSIPSSVKEIGPEAFAYTGLNEIDFSSATVETISKKAFRACDFETLKIPSTVKSIGRYAFYECTSLKAISLPTSLEYIGGYILDDCYMLEEITLPFIGKRADASRNLIYITNVCENLERVHVTNATSLKKNVFNECYNLEVLVLCDTLIDVADGAAFNDCYGISVVYLPLDIQSYYVYFNPEVQMRSESDALRTFTFTN